MEGALLFVYVQNAFSQRQSPGNVFNWDLLQVTESMAQTDNLYTPSISFYCFYIPSIAQVPGKTASLSDGGRENTRLGASWACGDMSGMLTGDVGSHLHNSKVKTSDAV